MMILNRRETSDQGTFGEVTLPNGLVLYTGELPWRDNRPRVSCVPEGVYECQWILSPRFGRTFQILDVPGRSHVLIHSGNWCGDTSNGYKSHVLGCVILGKLSGTLHGQNAVLISRPAITALHAAMGEDNFTLEVRNNGLF